MTSPRVFKLLVPAWYGSKLSVSGKIGPMPDTSILGGYGHCVRSRLPSFLDSLVFTFRTPHPYPEVVQNFYWFSDFFIVSHTMKEFMLDVLPKADVEVREVCVQHGDGTPAAEPYFALKIIKMIDCIDPVLSTGLIAPFSSSKELKPFSELTTIYELEAGLTAEFANRDGTHYVSYPQTCNQIQNVHLNEGEIPRGLSLFQPAFWPGFLIVEVDFGRVLESHCTGGSRGYYFWMLNLKGANQSHRELMHALR